MLHYLAQLLLGHPQFEELLRLDQLDVLLEASISHLTIELPLLQFVLVVLQFFGLNLLTLVFYHLGILRVDQMNDLASLAHVVSVERSQPHVSLNEDTDILLFIDSTLGLATKSYLIELSHLHVAHFIFRWIVDVLKVLEIGVSNWRLLHHAGLVKSDLFDSVKLLVEFTSNDVIVFQFVDEAFHALLLLTERSLSKTEILDVNLTFFNLILGNALILLVVINGATSVRRSRRSIFLFSFLWLSACYVFLSKYCLDLDNCRLFLLRNHAYVQERFVENKFLRFRIDDAVQRETRLVGFVSVARLIGWLFVVRRVVNHDVIAFLFAIGE